MVALKTLKQVWYQARGDKRMKEIRAFPDRTLGFLLYELWVDLFTWYGERDDILDQRIRLIADYLQQDHHSKSVH